MATLTTAASTVSSTYRADHVGSFLRAPEILQARQNHMPAEQLRALEDRHIARVLGMQKDLGLGVFTDGE